MQFHSLRSLFETGELPVIVSDSPTLLEKFKYSGFRVESVANVCAGTNAPVKDAMLIPAIPAVHPNTTLREALRGAAVLFVPLLAFSSNEDAFDYLIKRLEFLDFAAAQEKSRKLVEFIQHLSGSMKIETEGCSLTIDLSDNVDVFAPKLTPKIEIGESISIIQFLEVAIVPNADASSFSANGSFLCNGVSIAHHLHSHYQSVVPSDNAWDILSSVRRKGSFPLKLEVSDSKVTDIITSCGASLMEKIRPLTDKMHRGNLTEIGFGSLQASETTDWNINSQLNEPAGGVHLALGAGDTAAHIDFVSPGAVISGKLNSGEFVQSV